MGFDSVPMQFWVLPGSAISGAAFHDRAIELVHELTDEFGFQIVMTTHLTGGDLHGDLPP